MDIESNSESKDSMDSVAQALMNIFTNDVDTSEDHSLSMFLAKIYKNNMSAKPKRMNSIRLTRFNAFLYRLHANYPTTPNANAIIHNTLLAVLANDRNFQEEEDEEIVTSIGRWTCHLILETIQRQFYDSVYIFLKYLVDGERPQLQPVNTFEEVIRSQGYFSELELSSEDEKVALKEQTSYSITAIFSLNQFILQQLNIVEIYRKLFQSSNQKKEIVRLFNRHIAKTSPDNPADLFLKVFLNRTLSNALEIEAVLQALQENYFSHQATIKALELLIRQQKNISIYFGLRFKDTTIEKLFLQLLNEFWKKQSIDHLIEEFLGAKEVANIAILYLLINSETPVPRKYLQLPFEISSPLLYQHTMIFALALSHNNDKRLPSELIQLYLKHQGELSQEKKTLIFKAIHYSFTTLDKKMLYSNIINQTTVANFGTPASLTFLPIGELKHEKVSNEDKKRLLRMLQSHSDGSDNAMKIKAELLGLCNFVTAPTKRIKELNQLIQRPFEDILKHINEENIKRDPELIAALLMALNNKLYLTFVPEPRPEIIEGLSAIYMDAHHNFGKSVSRLQNDERAAVKKGNYYAALFRFGQHSKKRVGTLQGEIGDLLSGQCNYRRVSGVDFADYLIREEEKHGLAGQLWTSKKIACELRTLLENIVNFNVGNGDNRKELKSVMESEWIYPIIFEVLRFYFEAQIRDPQVLREMLTLLQPTYEFFQKVERTFNQQFEDYVDILYFTPEFLQEVYPEMLAFLAQLAESAPARKENKDKEREKRKSSKKKKIEKEKLDKQDKLEKQRAAAAEVYNNSDHILDNSALFETIMKRKQLRSLFGESESLSTFTPLITVLLKINDQFNRLERIVAQWLPTIKIFHCPKPELFSQWSAKVISYCELWQVFLVKKHFRLPRDELERHFHMLTEYLNTLYESKQQLLDFEEKILLTLLLIYQASCQDQPPEQAEVPVEALKNFFLGYRLSTPNQQHYYFCFTCNLPICQVCLPFLHKHHDVNYLGKDGFCVHDSTKRKEEEKDKQRDQREQREQRQKEIQRYQGLPGSSIFQPPAYNQIPGMPPNYQPGLMRNQRREDDWLMSTFEFPDEEMDFGEHLRFKEIMEMRLREQRDRERDREREKELLFSRERERMEKEREEILQMFEKEKNDAGNEEPSEIKSSSSKSIKNLHYRHTNSQYFTPEFTPTAEPNRHYHLSIDTRPLRCLLLRELHSQATEESDKLELGKIAVSLLNERYNFFNKSNYFKCNSRPDFGMMRGIGLGVSGMARRSLLTSNNRYLAYPTPNNGVILLVLANLLAKMTKRIQNRAMADFEQERGFLAGNINNSNFSFEPLQILFNRNSPNLLAIIGLNQLGFALLSAEGKLQKYSDSDFKSTDPIIKFMWLNRHRNIFAVATGSSIRLGHVNDEGRVKTTNRFRVHIDKPIRDFEINSEAGALFVYIIDNEGTLYRAEFDYRGAKTVNISEKKITYKENLDQLQSIIFVDKKILITSATSKCYILQVEGKGNAPAYQGTFDIEAALKAHEVTKFIKFPALITQLQVVQSSEHIFSVGCIVKRPGGDPKRRGGYLLILRASGKNSMEVILLHEEESIQSYQVTEMSESSFLVTAVDENGSVFCFNYQIPPELFSLREDTKIPIDDASIQLCNSLVRSNKLLSLVKYYEPKRYENFKESKEITGNYKVIIDSPHFIKATTNEPFKFFWTGILFTAEPKDQKPGQLTFNLLGRRYSFIIEKSRQIQIPFNVKQTVDIFTTDGEFSVSFQMNNLEVKNCRIYGMEYSAESIYKRAFIHLHKLVITYLAFTPTNVDQYLQNVDRHSLMQLDIAKLIDLKTLHKYSSKELNLLMKLELLRESIEEGFTGEANLEETLESVRLHLLPQCEKRHYLEKSCWKLIRRLCQLGLPLSNGVTGHPLQYRTVLDFYYFEGCYEQWWGTRQLGHFEQLVNVLYALIFKRIGNLYIIFKAYPDLIYELTTFYKTLLQSLKLSRNEARDQAQLHKLINICPNFVALVCEYYQTLRNSTNSMVDEKEEESPQNIILSLLEEVFCATRKQLYREVFISPQVYLQKLYLSPKEPHPLDTAIDVFSINDRPHQQHPREPNQPEEAKSEEEELELDEESEKEAVMEEEAREMEPIEEQDSSNEMQVEKQPNQKFRRIHSLLQNYLLPTGTRLTFTYYQFSFQMATALFTLDNHITPQNAVFYIGFLFNLLRIIELNLHPVRDAAYLKEFFQAVHTKIYSQKHSVLYMVLNYFFEPNYGQNQQKREIKPSHSKLSKEFVKYLQTEGISPASLFLGFRVAKTEPTVSLGQAMKFTTFSIENHLYQLKFLGNLYFNAKIAPTTAQMEAFKYRILAGVVRYGLRVLKNIMYFEGWQNELEEARVEVGFQTLSSNPSQGVGILVTCSKAHPDIFIKKLSSDPKKIETLEVLLESHKGDATKIIEMLTTYYSS